MPLKVVFFFGSFYTVLYACYAHQINVISGGMYKAKYRFLMLFPIIGMLCIVPSIYILHKNIPVHIFRAVQSMEEDKICFNNAVKSLIIGVRIAIRTSRYDIININNN